MFSLLLYIKNTLPDFLGAYYQINIHYLKAGMQIFCKHHCYLLLQQFGSLIVWEKALTVLTEMQWSSFMLISFK